MSQTQFETAETVEAAAAAWLARCDRGQWTADYERCLQAWLDQSTAHRVAWLRLQTTWQQADRMQALHVQADEKALATFEAPTPSKEHAWSRLQMRWATVVLVVLMTFIGLIWFDARLQPGEERYATPVGGLTSVTLADGSRVTLNTQTRARSVVNKQERKVWLEEGEAFFEVQHDPSLPFVVVAGADRITVLGTKFSVRHEAGRTQVTVLEGRVRLDKPGAKAEPVVVTRNDAAAIQSSGVIVIAKTATQVQQNLSWRQNRLVFDDMALGDIATEFNRYNRKQMVVEGEAAKVRLGGSFDAHNIEGFARLVHEGFGLNLAAENDTIRLSSN
jgi:transmembrane sensor